MHESLLNTEEHPTTGTNNCLFIITLTNYFSGSIKFGIVLLYIQFFSKMYLQVSVFLWWEE